MWHLDRDEYFTSGGPCKSRFKIKNTTGLTVVQGSISLYGPSILIGEFKTKCLQLILFLFKISPMGLANSFNWSSDWRPVWRDDVHNRIDRGLLCMCSDCKLVINTH